MYDLHMLDDELHILHTLFGVTRASYEEVMQIKNPSGIKSGLTNYGDPEFSVYIRRAFAKAMGYSDQELERPIVGIINTFSGFNSCHHNFADLIEAVKRGGVVARWASN